jgi:predicted ATP-grasp superfamily ATP-dependent carboligase
VPDAVTDSHLAPRTVSVFDVDLPPGVAFLRSLDTAGVPVVAYAARWSAPGRFSRHAASVASCPDVRDTDQFVAWLVDGFRREAIDLVAPTSDPVLFCVGAALDELGKRGKDIGFPDSDRVRTALFKRQFAESMAEAGFSTPPIADPLTIDDALAAAEEIGYPVVLKPRSHVGVGTERGVVARNRADLRRVFRRYLLRADQRAVYAHDRHIDVPILQRYHELGTVDVISVTGVLDSDGSVLALGHALKVSQSPRRLGVGTMFEPLDEQPFTADALRAVRSVVGFGMFELEILVDRATHEHWAIDLNPRGFGQMSLDIALGRDLPRLWYQTATGLELPTAATRRQVPAYWHEALASYVGLAVRLARGPQRGAIAEHALARIRRPGVEAMFEWRDPLPGLAFGLAHARHPGGLLRPFLTDTELAENCGDSARPAGAS